MRQAIAILLITLASMQSEARQPAAIQVVKVTPSNVLECFKKRSGTYCEARLNEYFNELSSLAGKNQWTIKHSSDNVKGN